AEHGVAQVADVRGLVRIDVRVLDDGLQPGGRRRRRCYCARAVREERRTVEEDIEVASAGDLDARDARLGLKRDLQRFSQCARVGLLPRRLLDALGQLESDGEGEVAQLRARRYLGRDGLKGDTVFFGSGRAHALAQTLL